MSRTDHHIPAKYRQDRPSGLRERPDRGRGNAGLSAVANRRERMARAEARAYTLLARRLYRAGQDIEQLTEPDGRTRHAVCRDYFWDFFLVNWEHPARIHVPGLRRQ